MTRKTIGAAAAAAALLSGFAIMMLLHAQHPQLPHMGPFGLHGASMAAPWGSMGWMTALGPVAMLLSCAGTLGLIVFLVRAVVGGSRP